MAIVQIHKTLAGVIKKNSRRQVSYFININQCGLCRLLLSLNIYLFSCCYTTCAMMEASPSLLTHYGATNHLKKLPGCLSTSLFFFHFNSSKLKWLPVAGGYVIGQLGLMDDKISDSEVNPSILTGHVSKINPQLSSHHQSSFLIPQLHVLLLTLLGRETGMPKGKEGWNRDHPFPSHPHPLWLKVKFSQPQ